jgi:hypothetical protein
MIDSRSSLPSNVRRWLDRSLPADAPLLNRIQHTQEGEMDIRGRWMPFMATTVYRAQPHTFTWKARFSMLPGVWLVAEDGHDDESGWGGAKLWGILPMGGRKGPEVRAMQLVRSLAELPWKPQLALALPGLAWNDASDTAFEVRTAVGDPEIAVCFELDGQGDIVRASGKRYYDVPDGFVEAPWRYDFSDHQTYEGIRMPAWAVATYDKADGPWVYWRGRITRVATDTDHETGIQQ